LKINETVPNIIIIIIVVINIVIIKRFILSLMSQELLTNQMRTAHRYISMVPPMPKMEKRNVSSTRKQKEASDCVVRIFRGRSYFFPGRALRGEFVAKKINYTTPQ
jgi:hypothetical protein